MFLQAADEHVEFVTADAVLTRLTEAQQHIAHLQQVQRHVAALLGFELRTQLTTLLGSSELLKSQLSDPLTGKQDRLVRQISATGESIFQIVSTVVEYQQIQAGVLVLNCSAVAAAPACRAVLSEIAALAAAKQQKVHLACEPQTLQVWVDEQRLHTMLGGLLREAVHCAPVGGRLEVAARATVDGCAAFEIVYFGPAIRADEQALLFQPFIAANYTGPQHAGAPAAEGMTSIDCLHGGRRLGVVLARDLAELHGGALSFDSCAGQGGRFTLTLPLPGAAASA